MPNIVVNDITPRIQYVASIGQTVFAFPFLMFFPTDINVYKRPLNAKPEDTVDILTYNIDYTVFINPQPAIGGTITLLVPAAAGDIVTLARNQPDQRLNYYIQGGPFTSNMVNFDFDQIILMDQQRQMYDEVIGVHYNVNAIVEPVVDNILPILPPLCVWMKNEADTEIIAVPFDGGGGGGGDSIIIVVVQPNHGFVAGQVVYSNAGTYTLAMADNAAEAEVIGIVESVTNVNTFNLCVGGLVTSLVALTPGGVYFLSDAVPGLLTLTEPTTEGHISKPLLIATSAGEGVFYNMRGKIISTTGFGWQGVVVDTAMQANQGYYLTGGGALQMTLPTSILAGQEIAVKGYNSASWRIVQNAGQQINFGNQQTTLGAGGYIESQNPHDDIRLLCVVADTIFEVLGAPMALNLTII